MVNRNLGFADERRGRRGAAATGEPVVVGLVPVIRALAPEPTWMPAARAGTTEHLEHMMILLRPALATSLALLAALPISARGESGRDGSAIVVAQFDARAEYQRKLAVYEQARAAYDEKAEAYWNAIGDKRKARFAKRRDGAAVGPDDYVLVQPPVYTGPPAPVDPDAPEAEPRERRYVPVVADFLLSAQTHFQFVPRRAANEFDFKRAYAAVAAGGGLTAAQAARVYGFECGGNGTHDVQAGLEYSKDRRAISTALGYNQLLIANTLDILAEHGPRYVAYLDARAATLSGPARQSLVTRVAALKRMVAFAKSVPYAWANHVKLADTEKGWGVHALNLDLDIGPLLQTQKLVNSLVHARRKGWTAPLTASELEMMNLTGDGNGFDMVTMPQWVREQVPTANFFQRGGYGRNPVAQRNNTVARLIAATDVKMDKEGKLPGAREMLAAFGMSTEARR
jgi:hypothetical protein